MSIFPLNRPSHPIASSPVGKSVLTILSVVSVAKQPEVFTITTINSLQDDALSNLLVPQV